MEESTGDTTSRSVSMTNNNNNNNNSDHSYTTTMSSSESGFSNTTVGGIESLYKDGKLPKVIQVRMFVGDSYSSNQPIRLQKI